LVGSLHLHLSPGHPLPIHLRQIKEVSSFYFLYVYEAHQSYCFIIVSSIHTSFLQVPPIHYTYFIVLRPCLLTVGWH
jgi:hypothetical protein